MNGYGQAMTDSGLGSLGATAAPPSASMLAAMMGDLSEAIALSGNIGAQLYDVRMNLFGPWPQKGESSSEVQPDPVSTEQRLALAFSRLRHNLLAAQEHAEIIRNRL